MKSIVTYKLVTCKTPFQLGCCLRRQLSM